MPHSHDDNGLKGYDKSPDYGVRFTRKDKWIIDIGLIIFAIIVVLVNAPRIGAETFPVIKSVYWTDGDSGHLTLEDGSIREFRLANIDAPETGGVGAAIGGAECENERKLGYEAKAFVNELTKDAAIQITQSYGIDKYDRLVVDLSAGGADIAQSGITAGHLKKWPYKGRKALTVKPDWCR